MLIKYPLLVKNSKHSTGDVGPSRIASMPCWLNLSERLHFDGSVLGPYSEESLVMVESERLSNIRGQANMLKIHELQVMHTGFIF